MTLLAVLYPHSWREIPFDGPHVAKGEHYCERCHMVSRAAGPGCEYHPDYPFPVFSDPEILPGDVIEIPTGITREVGRFVVHESARLRNGAQALRGRHLSNPRGIDWRLYVEHAEPELRILARGVARVDSINSLMADA